MIQKSKLVTTFCVQSKSNKSFKITLIENHKHGRVCVSDYIKNYMLSKNLIEAVI